MTSLRDFPRHAKTMMRERLIQEDWVINAVNNPDMTEEKMVDEKHYLKQIPQNRGNFCGYRQSICFSSTGDHGVL